MKKHQVLLILFIIIIYLGWNYYDYESSRKRQQAFLSDLNISVIDMKAYLSVKSIQTDANHTFWDLEKSSLLLDREKKLKLLTKNQNQNLKKNDDSEEVDLKKRVICLGEECWEFFGIVEINNRPQVTLLSKDKKLQTFFLNDMLLENIKIIKIRGDELVVEDIKKKKQFSLKLFEVDIHKFLPKKSIKEKND